MDHLRALFTIRPLNPLSYLIRAANPPAAFRMGPASHVLTLDGDTGYCLEANMLHGVRRVKVEDAIKGAKVVADVSYEVPDAQAGLEWMRATADRNAKYDWPGALGLGLAPSRNWQQDDSWFCFEYHTMGMEKSGRTTFANHSRVSAHLLLSLNPAYYQAVLPAAA